ncbi:hypothetical protein BDN70DRAFT_690309 [Pholiota conissans]|uniref:Uncharacterized protein n=1 Tax=Pholiota conissans TaxID=109636 RepID=A0A9P5Z125_9AGAR|nr:hypothetical protein BDN70DRAFT_690309 [Pholiota conissans]
MVLRGRGVVIRTDCSLCLVCSCLPFHCRHRAHMSRSPSVPLRSSMIPPLQMDIKK